MEETSRGEGYLEVNFLEKPGGEEKCRVIEEEEKEEEEEEERLRR
jgi:hypothetical protein